MVRRAMVSSDTTVSGRYRGMLYRVHHGIAEVLDSSGEHILKTYPGGCTEANDQRQVVWGKIDLEHELLMQQLSLTYRVRSP